MRDLLLRSWVLLGAVLVLLTEALSPFHLLRRAPIAIAWTSIGLAAVGLIYRRRALLASMRPRELRRRFATASATGIAGGRRGAGLGESLAAGIAVASAAAIAAIVGLIAVMSPPNGADAMAYHLPRVVYWAQSGSVAFFPTPYFNQIMLQPLAEYIMLHTYVLSGGDHLINLVAWAAFVGNIAGVSAIAAAYGLGRRGQAFAALFCATLPGAILQASGAKNDMVLALWLVCAAYFAARRDAMFTGLSAGLALATKATAYPFLPAIFLLPPARPPSGQPRKKTAAAWLLAGILLLNAPQYARNIRLSGSLLGYDSAQGDGRFRWRNEHFGWKPAVSNALRHLSEQLGARGEGWNMAVYHTVIRIHRALGIDPQDPDTTWPGAQYAPPVNSNHEANANNRWHLLLIAIAALFGVAARDRVWALYAAGLLLAFLLFCAYLKWQPFMARLELPLFILAAPLAAAPLKCRRLLYGDLIAIIIALFLISGARRPLFENWTRPLKGPGSLFVTARDANYFSDMVQWNNRASYFDAVDRVAASECAVVGIDISENQLEYPFQALLRERKPGVIFIHTGVENASTRYAPANPSRPCAVLCPDCIGNQKKIAMYGMDGLGPSIEIGRFLLFLPPAR